MLEAPRREPNGLLGSVEDPSKDDLVSAPVGISLAKVLGRDGLLTKGGIAGNPGMKNSSMVWKSTQCAQAWTAGGPWMS